MKNEKVMLEFKDPFAANVSSFAMALNNNPVSVAAEPKIEVPNVPVPEFASDETTIQSLDLRPENVDCAQDLFDNWGTYLGLSAFLAFTLKSVLPPILRAAGGSLKAFGQACISLIKGDGKRGLKLLGSSVAAVTVSPLKQTVKAVTTFGGIGSTAAGIQQAFQGNPAAGKLKNNIVFRGASGVWKSSWAAITGIKNVAVLAGVVALGYYGLGFKNFLGMVDEESSDTGAVGMTAHAIESVLSMFIWYEAALEIVATKVNSNVEEECVLTNTIAGAILLTVMFGMKSKTKYSQEDLMKMDKDQLRTFLIGEKRIRLSDLNRSISEGIKGPIGKLNLDLKTSQKYIDALMTKPEKALAILVKSGVDAKKAAKFHKNSLKLVQGEKSKFVSSLNSERAAQKALLNSQSKSSEVRAALRHISKASLGVARKLKLDPRTASKLEKGASKAALTAAETKELSKILMNLPGMGKVFNIKTIDDLAASTRQIETLVAGGQISAGKAVQIYKNVFSPKVAKMSRKLIDEVVPAARAGDDVVAATSRVERMAASLQKLKDNEKILADLLKNLSPRDSIKAADWIFMSKSLKDAKQLKNVNVAKEAIQLAKREIASIIPGASVKDIAKMESSIAGALKAVDKVSKANRGPTMGRVVASGIAIGIIQLIAKEISAENTKDLETWQRADLARHLAWEGWTGPTKMAISKFQASLPDSLGKPLDRVDAYRESLGKIAKNMSTPEGLSVMKRIYKDLIFQNNDGFIKKIVNNYANQGDFSSSEATNEFRIEKKNYQDITDALETNFNADIRGFGARGLSNEESSINYRKIWHPIIISIMIANSGIVGRFETQVRKNDSFWDLPKPARVKWIKEKVLKYDEEDTEENLLDWFKQLKKQMNLEKNTGENQMKENKKNDIEKLSLLVKEVISENRGQGYNTYPYSSQAGDPEEPAEDFIEDWKAFELSLTRDETRDTAIEVAKILVRDLELFGDVIDLVGKNQSVATEILKAMRAKEETTKKA